MVFERRRSSILLRQVNMYPAGSSFLSRSVEAPVIIKIVDVKAFASLFEGKFQRRLGVFQAKTGRIRKLTQRIARS